MDRGSSPAGSAISRRVFLVGAAALLLWPFARRVRADEALPAPALAALRTSPFVYVSPLRADGSESRCHAEVWFGWIDGAVVLTTGKATWKARALSRGLDRARLWVGDFGSWKTLGIPSERFRSAPHFDARASRVTDAAVNERLLAVYDAKYPDSIGRWRDKMREGFRSGERVVIRYEPI
jgi:hypothetical protein